MDVLYKANATATGGRLGHVATSDGVLELELVIPKEMGGSGGAKTNPEQLFAAGYAACFDSALQHVARQQKIKLNDTSVSATVGIGPNDSGGFGLEVHLGVKIPGVDRDVAAKLVEQTHHVCPYSNAIRGNVEITTTIL